MNDAPLRRFRLDVHYDGSDFHGWQVQPEVPTIQGEIEAVLERISGAHRTVHGSGRTDTGVHATGQVAAVDLPATWEPRKLHHALNGLLPRGIWIEAVSEVPVDFHPRFDAVDRTYHYRLGIDPRAHSPFHRPFCWALTDPVDVDLMRDTARILVGDHSFLAFAKAGQEERGDRCVVEGVAWATWEVGVEFRITANRYLHHMVRYLVGTLVDIGRGRREPGDLGALLETPEGGLVTSVPAPPEGLFLARVRYDWGLRTHPPRPPPDALRCDPQMNIFLDTAEVSEIRRAAEAGLIDGVTTNPSLMAKVAGDGDPQDIFLAICEAVDGPVSAEVVAVDAEGMVTEGRRLAALADNIVVKLPLTEHGLRACRTLTSEGVRTNVTLCFSAPQALLAAKAGATYISPFIGRLDDIGGEGMQLIGQIRQIYDNYGMQTQILAASIRHPMHMVDAMMIGADCATLPPKVLYQLLKHPLTDRGLEAFLADWKSTGKEL